MKLLLLIDTAVRILMNRKFRLTKTLLMLQRLTRYWLNFLRLPRNTKGNFFIAIASLFVFGSWLFHDVINPDYTNAKTNERYNEISLKVCEVGKNDAALLMGQYLTMDSTKNNMIIWGSLVLGQYVFSLDQIQSTQFAIRNTKSDKKDSLLKSIDSMGYDN